MTNVMQRFGVWGTTGFFHLLLLGVNAVSAQSDAMHAGGVNVRDFGAVGDGVADDTQAIQKALDATSGLVMIPPGRYRVAETLSAKDGQIVGQGQPTIHASNPDMTVLEVTAHRTTVQGITFLGGKDQLSIGNGNIDQGLFKVIDCWFYKSSGVAVQFREKSNSTFGLVEKCLFSECMQAFVGYTDQMVLRDSWVTSSLEMKDKAVIENHGWLICENIVGVPLVNGHNQRWIDNYVGRLSCRSFRFGGEFGGFTPVVNFAKREEKLGGPSISLQDCWVSALGNSQSKCAIYLEEIPNQISITSTALAGVPPILIRPDIDLNMYFAGVRPGMLRFDLNANQGEFAMKLPQALLDAVARAGAVLQQDVAISEQETQALAAAAEKVNQLPDAEPGVMNVQGGIYPEPSGHRQQTDPANFVDITSATHPWDIADYMDATRVKTGEFLAVAQAKNDTVVMLRKDVGNNWPHVLIRDIEVDLDRTPYLSWRLKDTGAPAPGYGVKIVDVPTGKTLNVAEVHQAPFYDYRAYDLRRLLGERRGLRTIQVRFYFLGLNIATPEEIMKAHKGDFWAVDFLRLESPSADNNQ